ncbi:MAG: hypothetical protein WCE52_17835 [Candidatus Acidiferrum sp.]
MLKQLQVHRQILFDLTSIYLDPMPGAYARLAYVAGLRDPGSQLYSHPVLSQRYPAERVSESIHSCHEELFEKLLELPLATLEQDLHEYFASLPETKDPPQPCADLTISWIPIQAPDYLKELYRSNQAALCVLVQRRKPTAHSNT